MAVKKISTLGPGRLELTPAKGEMKSFSGDTTVTKFTPEYETEDATAFLDGSEDIPEGKLTATISGTMRQDYGTDSLVKYCWDHMGETVGFLFVPNITGKMQIKGECVIKPVEIGGDVKTANTTDFEFPIVGKPELSEDYTPTESSVEPDSSLSL